MRPLLFIVALAVAALSSVALAQDPRDIQAAFRAAKAAYDREDFEAALETYRLIAESPDAAAEARAVAYDAVADIQFIEKHDVEAAVLAESRAIELVPDSWRRLQYRGAYRTTTGRPDLALPDLERAVALAPDVSSTRGARGLALLGLGRFDAAAGDLEAALAIDPSKTYLALALHVARLRADRDDSAAFSAHAARFGGAVWPGPVFAFYAGDLTSDGLLRVAETGPEAGRNDRLCEASYYIGQSAMAAGDTTRARQLFETAVAICGFAFSERGSALSELERLR